jgi:hypothetical protein
MTENAKIARLWSKFHRLPEGHRELIGHPEKISSDIERITVFQNIDSGEERYCIASLKK